ncbi:hypothetical protein FNF29_06850 [Cafeteria roenbergensis]|uniref:Sulfatase-modifying factor enzyme-like domain-containing protein n=1 Tax=Cafeteria roenbergensis TaxID=33653 RepID=A0A5A8C8L6_CAFRO|nr:hypothetical protein FNF29_06850 [Cafeteria roenbergensis]|eukprot:KAA0148191.1 hypothetical protein FNF29_06850 [Cafeteria roenbergensis]
MKAHSAAWLAAVALAAGVARANRPDFREQIVVPGGRFGLGTDHIEFPLDAEGPARPVTVKPFVLDKYEVSIDRFAEFVNATGYITEAERFGWSFVHEKALDEAVLQTITQAVQSVPWWLPVDNASWSHPEGAASDASGRGSHPAVHLSHADADAFCAWAMPGGRLPTEVEWERAARGGKEGRMYAWGNKLKPRNKHRANIWQGQFPLKNTARDGFKWAAPVDAFGPQNQWGFHGVAGNAWEWTATEWCDPARPAPDCRGKQAPADAGDVEWVKKGGSFLCHKSYCFRYRVAARTKNTANSGAYNLGARCARDATPEEQRLVESGSAVQVGAPEVGNAVPPSTEGVTDGAKVGYRPGQHAAAGADEL